MTEHYCHSLADVWHAVVACAQVNERLKNVRFNTASTTRDVMKEKHKDALMRDREKAEALFKSE